jgi:RNA polymerase sigma factor for flagellar operon FliA
MTMREIGMALGVVESRVSQIHASAVLHLRSALSDLSGRTGQSASRSRYGSGKSLAKTERAVPADAVPRLRASH